VTQLPGERIRNVKKIVLALLLGVLAIGAVSTSIGCNDTKSTKTETKK